MAVDQQRIAGGVDRLLDEGELILRYRPDPTGEGDGTEANQLRARKIGVEEALGEDRAPHDQERCEERPSTPGPLSMQFLMRPGKEDGD